MHARPCKVKTEQLVVKENCYKFSLTTFFFNEVIVEIKPYKVTTAKRNCQQIEILDSLFGKTCCT